MMPIRKIACAVFIVCATFSPSSVRAVSVIRWINGSNENGSTVLNSGSTFTTSFRTANDVTATRLSGALGALFTDNFGGATPGNNPSYLTSFVGSTVSWTGDGTAGHVGFLDFGGGATSSAQFDFSQPLTSADRLLFVDADSTEQYHVEAYALVGASYVPLSLGGWTYETFSGQTGVTPDSRWPTWNAASGLLTAGTSGLNEELSVLTPDQQVSRLVISKTTGAGASTGFQVIEVTGTTGDYNANGVADAGDYVMWRKNANTTNVLANDTIGGTIGTLQYNQWRAHFGLGGSGAGSADLAVAVAEPAVVTQILLLAAVLSTWHRRNCAAVA
jgi:hypothetical protein